jgi:hypothetical protein
LGTAQIDLESAAVKLVTKTATFTQNYWSLLACQVEEQEETLETDSTISVDKAMTATTATNPVNKVAAHWAQKVINRRLQKMGILDTGATSGAAPEEDEDAFEDTGKLSKKTFMFPEGTNKAMKKMCLKHKLCPAAREMNIVPGLHLTLVSIPKLADAGYTTVFSKKGSSNLRQSHHHNHSQKAPHPGS